MANYLQAGIAKIIGAGREVRARRADGVTFPVHLSVGEMSINGERKFTGILHDLSARVRMEEQLVSRPRWCTWAKWRPSLLTRSRIPWQESGRVQVIGSCLPDSRDAAVTDEIVKRIDGLNDLMRDLLLFARPPQPKRAAVDVAALVSSTAGLLAVDPSVANVRVEVAGVAPPIVADPELLKIAFVNLLINAAHAMEGKGVIRVSVQETEGWCCVAFHDAGPGIPTDIREKIFTPFFTTKSKGTGLGLPTTKRLIEAHAGRIEIDCPPGGGTIVIVELPAKTAPLR